jgi:hypothetical protein
MGADTFSGHVALLPDQRHDTLERQPGADKSRSSEIILLSSSIPILCAIGAVAGT